jgi:hypothetical protein
MSSRHATATLFAALAVGLGACGGDGDEPSSDQATGTGTTTGTTTGTGTGAPSPPVAAPKTALPKAAAFYNRGFQRLVADVARHTTADDFEAVKADVARFRIVILELDERIRAIRFDPSRQTEVNQILDRNQVLITRLDAFAETESFEESTPVYDQALKARTASLNAINKLIETL